MRNQSFIFKKMPVVTALIILSLFFFPLHSEAHAVLIKANPAPNSHLLHSPSSIRLTFNERLQKELYYIKVFDSTGHTVGNSRTVMSVNQHQLHLTLPKLKNGVYTISYHVISADGHPVAASFPLTIGKGGANQVDPSTSNAAQAHGGMSFILLNALYYFSLLSVIGLTIWSMILRKKERPEPSELSFWFSSLIGLLLLMLFGMGYLNLSLGIGDVSFHHLYLLLFKTTTGITTEVLIVAAIAGFFFLRKTLWFDCVWIVIMCLTEAVNGHAAAFHPQIYTIALDFIHLIAASIWTGGLVLVLLYFASHEEQAWSFTTLFSKGAFISLVTLIVTGTLEMAAFLPTPGDLFISTWGLLLIIKICLVIAVVILASILRRFLSKKNVKHFKQMLMGDVTAMALILAIVGGLTNLSPLPANSDYDIQATSHGYHIHLTIQPRNPGTTNAFSIDVSDKKGAPKSVSLILTNKENSKLAPISVPLIREKPKTTKHEYVFTANGPYIPTPGTYNVQVEITDRADNVHVINESMKVYPVKVIK